MIARFRILLLALALCAGPASVCGAFPTAPIPHSATAKTARQAASTAQPPAEHPSTRATDTAVHRTAAQSELQRAPQVPPPDRAGAGGSRLPHPDGVRSADRRAQRLPRRDAAQDSINILSENNLRLYDSIEARAAAGPYRACSTSSSSGAPRSTPRPADA